MKRRSLLIATLTLTIAWLAPVGTANAQSSQGSLQTVRTPPQCATYMRIYECYLGHLPAAAKGPVADAYRKTIEAWKKGIQAAGRSSTALKAIEDGCRQAVHAFIRAVRTSPMARDCIPQKYRVGLPKVTPPRPDPNHTGGDADTDDDSDPETSNYDPGDTTPYSVPTISQDCPPHTSLVGAAPPRGTAQWCEKRNNVKHGRYTWWYSGGGKREEGTYKNGKKDGVWISYRDGDPHARVVAHYRNEKLHGSYRKMATWEECVTEQGQYRYGKRVGTWIFRSKDSNPDYPSCHRDEIKSYKRGKLHGEYLKFADGSKKIATKGRYSYGKKTGKWVFRDGNGTKIREGSYSGGKRRGTWFFYYSSGALKKKAPYFGGKMNGIVIEFHANGKMQAKGRYSAGKRTGTWVHWDAYGRRVQRASYERGKLSGKGELWYPNGRRKLTCHFKNGVKHGRCISYSDTGAVTLDYYWEYGHRVGGYTDGKRTGTWTFYRSNGRWKSRGTYCNGRKCRWWISYDENGRYRSRHRY